MGLLLGFGRAVVWGLTGIGLLEATEAVNGTSDEGSSGPSFFAWAVVLGVLGFAGWLFMRSRKGG